MRTDPERWEHGSFQHWPDYRPAESRLPWPAGTPFWLSARSGLVALHRERRWPRLWIPEYFCQQVAHSLVEAGIPLRSYPDSPVGGSGAWPDDDGPRAGDAVLSVNTLGLRARPRLAPLPPDIDLIEDHTHDPVSDWAASSQADWAVASLRKTAPLGIGGVLWSPRGRRTPAPRVAEDGGSPRETGLGSMVLKRLYLAGHAVEKDVYLRGFARLEAALETADLRRTPEWTEALAATFPWHRWRRSRADNFGHLASSLRADGAVEVLKPDSGAVPFGVVAILPDAGACEALRRGLIERSVYSPRLWDLEDSAVRLSPATVDLSRRLLVLHCDYRYGERDLDRVAAAVAEILL